MRQLTLCSAASCSDCLLQVGGTLKDWNVTQQLGSIQRPALVLQGEHDVVLPETGQRLAAGLKTDLVTLPNSGSYVHIDAYQDCLSKIKDHLEQHDP